MFLIFCIIFIFYFYFIYLWVVHDICTYLNNISIIYAWAISVFFQLKGTEDIFVVNEDLFLFRSNSTSFWSIKGTFQRFSPIVKSHVRLQANFKTVLFISWYIYVYIFFEIWFSQSDVNVWYWLIAFTNTVITFSKLVF